MIYIRNMIIIEPFFNDLFKSKTKNWTKLYFNHLKYISVGAEIEQVAE